MNEKIQLNLTKTTIISMKEQITPFINNKMQ